MKRDLTKYFWVASLSIPTTRRELFHYDDHNMTIATSTHLYPCGHPVVAYNMPTITPCSFSQRRVEFHIVICDNKKKKKRKKKHKSRIIDFIKRRENVNNIAHPDPICVYYRNIMYNSILNDKNIIRPT